VISAGNDGKRSRCGFALWRRCVKLIVEHADHLDMTSGHHGREVMDSELKKTFIQRVAKENQSDPGGTKILWSRHAVAELAVEGWKRREVEGALLNSDIIEDYPTLHRSLPDCLVLAWVKSAIPIHVVAAIDEESDRILVVTVYQPAEEEWEDDWRTRK
jgi:hypothetical protein